MIEQPAVQVLGAGLNSTVTVDLSGDATTNCNDDGTPGVSAGEGFNVQFVMAYKQLETIASWLALKVYRTAVVRSLFRGTRKMPRQPRRRPP